MRKLYVQSLQKGKPPNSAVSHSQRNTKMIKIQIYKNTRMQANAQNYYLRCNDPTLLILTAKIALFTPIDPPLGVKKKV